MNGIAGTVITSLEVAQMVDKKHCDLLRDIRKYCVTKKGCEFIAHKLTGQKGTEFTARYINRFHEMEQELRNLQPAEIPVGEVASYLKVMDRVAVRQSSAPYKIAQAFKMVSEQFGIQLPADFVKVPEFEQMALELRKNGGAA